MYPVKKLVMPKDLAKVKNGVIPAKLLTNISGGSLHHLAAKAWNAMVKAAKEDKIVLKPISRWDTYRPYERQEAVFLARFQLENNGSKVTRQWRGKTWYLKKGYAPVAVPGTSNHGWGLAVDIAGVSGPTLEWLKKNADKFGFSWEVRFGPNAEAWHLRYYSGDVIPPAVSAS